MSAILDHILEQASIPPAPLSTHQPFFFQCSDNQIKSLEACEAVHFQSLRFLFEQEIRDPIPIHLTSVEFDAVQEYVQNPNVLQTWSSSILLSLANFSDTILFPKLHWDCCMQIATLLRKNEIVL